MRERGFNQSELIARAYASHTDRQRIIDVLVRNNATRAQAELTREERQHNVVGAFSCTSSERVIGRSILLVDDVFTTGATLNEAARTLRMSGAQRICALTFAHG